MIRNKNGNGRRQRGKGAWPPRFSYMVLIKYLAFTVGPRPLENFLPTPLKTVVYIGYAVKLNCKKNTLISVVLELKGY